MGETSKFYSSEKIGIRKAETNTRSNRINNQVHRTDTRGPSIYGITRRIRRRLRPSVYGGYRGLGNHCIHKRMDPRVPNFNNNTDKPRSHTINFRTIYVRLTIGMYSTGRSEGTPQTHTHVHVLRKYANIGMV